MKITSILLRFVSVTYLAVAIGPSDASTPKIISYKTQKHFAKGTPKGISIDSFGRLLLAPAIEEVSAIDIPFVWAGATDGLGNNFLGGGNLGKIFKIDSNNKVAEFVEIERKQVYAMATDANNNLYIGSSPDGKVYKIATTNTDANLEESIFFDPEELYIWSMVVDSHNNVFVATGEKGNIYKVATDGTSRLLYESEDTHVRTLTLTGSGDLIAGTASKALVIKIGPDGNAEVLYDSPLVEIAALVSDQIGNVYVAAAGATRIPRRSAAGQAVQVADSPDNPDPTVDSEIKDSAQAISGGGATPTAGRSALYRINTNGTIDTFETGHRELIFSLAVAPSGIIFIGTGDNGRLYSMTPAGERTLVTEFEDEQITVLEAQRDGNMIAGTSNSGRLYKLGSRFTKSGEYLSDVHDAKVVAKWGSISWKGQTNSKTRVRLKTRSGNTKEPDKSWSTWSRGYVNAAGETIQSPSSRFIQFKVLLSSSDGLDSPELDEVAFSYLQKNVAPTINEITLHRAGEYYPEAVSHSSGNGSLDGTNGVQENGFQNQSPGRKTYKKGFQSASWKSKDQNDDKLSFHLFYRAEDETYWKPLVEDYTGYVYSWDSELFPDGRYFLKLEAHDNLSNPPSFTLSSEKISQSFTIDNTGPMVFNIETASSTGSNFLTFTVQDNLNTVKTVEYSINAQDWKLVYPTDDICDSKTEVFRIAMDGNLTGENNIAIKAKDQLGNIGFGKTRLRF